MVDVAFAAGLSPETLRKIESGRIATPSFATVASIAAAGENLGTGGCAGRKPIGIQELHDLGAINPTGKRL